MASFVFLLIEAPHGTPISSDPGAPTIPIWVSLLPAIVGIALVLLLPQQRTSLPVVPQQRRSLHLTTGILVLLAIAFPVLTATVPLKGENYVLGKLLLFMVVPAIVLLIWRHSIQLNQPSVSWRWWAPAIVVAVWTYLSQMAPWVPQHDLSSVPTEELIIAASATAITAGLGEELFYRRWLQSRAEALLGSGAGIALTALAFAFMHLGSHGSGNLPLDVASVVVNQGSFGLLMGILWWRYRNFTMIVLAHLIVNGWGVVAHLLGAG